MASPVLVGRTAELAVLEGALARSGPTAAVVVAGEAGAGKSRLVAEFTAAAAAGGTRVLTGRCVALGSEGLPYAPFLGALGQLAAQLGEDGVDGLVGAGRADLARLVPELRRPDDDHRPSGAADRAVLFQVVLRTMDAAAALGPLVVVIEDLHWADASSRELLSFLVGRVGDGMLFVATYRNDEIHRHHPLRPFLAEAARSERVTRLDLAPLTPAEVTRQLEAIAGAAPPRSVVDAVVARAEGNPFFAEELLAAGGGPELPPDLAEVLTARLAALPEAAQRLVGVAAVAGPRVGHDLLTEVAARCAVDCGPGLRDALFHHVLVADPAGGYAFRHALLAEAACGELLPAERVALHAAYATTLAAHPEWATTPAGAAAELAHHYASARNPERALHAAVAAAAAASDSYAFGEAFALYEQALALWDQVPEPAGSAGCDHAQLIERAADAATLAGATRRAIDLARAALDGLDPSRDPARVALLHWRLARLLWTNGEGEASLDAHRTAVALMPSDPSADRARILAADGHVLALSARYQESRLRCEEAISVARAAGARREEGYALNTLGADLSRLGDPAGAIACLEQALAIAEDLGSVEEVWRAYYNLSVVLYDAGQLQRAASLGRDGVARVEALGYEEGATRLRCMTAGELTDAGRWDEAGKLAGEALQRPVSDYTTWLVREAQGTIAVRRGDYPTAHAALEDARRLWSTGYPELRANLDASLAELALGEGRLADARALVDEGLDALTGSDAQDYLQRLVALGLRVEGDEATRRAGRDQKAGAAGPRHRSEELIERSRTVSVELDRRGVPLTYRGDVLRRLCEAEFARTQGRSDPDLWSATSDAWAGFSHPYESAYARWRQAEAHLTRGEREPAAEALRDALRVAAQLGATPLTQEIEALGRRARIRLRAGEGDSQPSESVETRLSRRELEVLALVASGHTNREIATRLYMAEKTASVHVSHILTKLGLANRGQASALAHRLNLVDKGTAR